MKSTIAKEIEKIAKDANEAMNLAQANEIKEQNQDWENESTTYIFADDSKLYVQNNDFKVI